MPEPTDHHVDRVVLPSGKVIEVVYFSDQAPAPAAAPAEHGDELHLCGSCDSDLVYPIGWQEAGSRHWAVALRCPNCEWRGTGVYSEEVVERFDELLDHGTEAVVRDLKQLMHANMEHEIECFTRALQAGLIEPSDF